MERRLEKAIEHRGIEVDDALHQDLSAVIVENSSQVMEQHAPGSFSRIFWQQQERGSRLKNAKSMRWEPAMIRFVVVVVVLDIFGYLAYSDFYRWCIYLRHLSSSAYELLRSSGILKLPSQRTLRDYTYHTHSCHGFSNSVDQQLMDLAKIDTCRPMDKYVVIIMDEMHIREDIVYDKHTGECIMQFYSAAEHYYRRWYPGLFGSWGYQQPPAGI